MGKLKLLKQFQQYYFKEKEVLKKVQLMLLLLFVSSNVFSKGYSQTELLLNFRNTKVENVISFIEKRTEYRFLYQTSEVDLKRKININFRGKISRAVSMLFEGTAVYPVIVNKQIILKKRVGFAQDKIVTGIVTDEDKIPLEGVTVLVNKYERGTSTDANGKYKINVKSGDKISFSYIGFKDYEVVVSNQTVINVALKEDISVLDEVVLIGYGKEKRANVATAISTIKGNDLKTNIQSGASFERGLDGLVKGVFVTQGSGELGKGADIIIRGVTSPNFVNLNRRTKSNNPLYVIDGVAIFTNPETGNNPLQSINPEDIESVEVLKDAAATAIYGSRGANGVIIVKTKIGLYDQPTTVNLSFKTTLGTPVNKLDYLNAAEFKDYILAINQNSIDYYNSLKEVPNNEDLRKPDPKREYGNFLGLLPSFGFYFSQSENKYMYDPSRIKFYNADTDWNDVVFRTPITSTINASVNGGGEKSLYNLSLGYVNQEGILRAEKKQQYNARLSTQFDVSDRIKIGASVNYTNVNIETGYSTSGLDGDTTSFGSGILQFRPDLPVYDQNGDYKYDEEPNPSGGNPVLRPNPLVATTLSTRNNNLSNSILTNIFAEYDITDALRFKADFSYGLFLTESKNFKPKKYSIAGYVRGKREEIKGAGSEQLSKEQRNTDFTELDMDATKTINSSINYTLEYTKEFNKNSFKGLLGFSHTTDKYRTDNDSFKAFISEIALPQYSKIQFKRRNIQNINSGLNSYFARASYNYDEKYGITGVIRLDRSSKFAFKNRNAFFPSVAANWNIHRENFMDNSFIRELRLRASAGLTGSVTIDDFVYVQKFAVGNAKYKDTPVIQFDGDLANEDASWEKTKEYNLGLDFSLKRNVLSGSIDFYHKTTSDVVTDDYVPMSSGQRRGAKNHAKILNKGFELSLTSNIINNENFIWSVGANASKNINRVLHVSGRTLSLAGRFDGPYVVGRETNVLKGYIVEGIIQTPEELKKLQEYAKTNKRPFYNGPGLAVGDYKYKDVNGDGHITGEDIVILGSRQPDLFGGFNTNLSYKGFSLGANFTYALGLESFRYNEGNEFGKFRNIQRYMSPKYRWSTDNRDAKLPRLIHTGNANSQASEKSSANIFDASYLRLSSARLGYDLPQSTISSIGFSRVNIYISGTNLATWTKFPGLDPQGASAGAASAGNRENFDAYPLAKTFSLGLNLKF